MQAYLREYIFQRVSNEVAGFDCPHWLQQPSLPIPTLLGQREPLEVFRNLRAGNRAEQGCQNTEN